MEGLLSAADALLAYGLKPYLTSAHAVNEWVFGIDHSLHLGASLQSQWSLVTVLPDLRAKVISAEWLPGTLHLELDTRVSVDQIQLQIIHSGAANGHQLLAVKAGEQEIEIPDDAHKLSIFVVDQGGDCVAQLHLGSVYGGRIYVGVDDDGLPQGEVEACRILRGPAPHMRI